MARTINGAYERGKLIHRRVTPEQAAILRRAIANYRKAKKLLKAWEVETERLMDTETMQFEAEDSGTSRSLDEDAPRSNVAGLGNGPTPHRVN